MEAPETPPAPPDKLSAIAWVIVVAHLFVGIGHSVPHRSIPIPSSSVELLLIGGAFFAAPLVGVVLLADSDRRRQGALVMGASLGAALVHGILLHFVLEGPDNILSVPVNALGFLFVGTAAVLTGLESFGVAVAVLLFREPRAAPLSERAPPSS